jgi:hypothetical protein
MITVCTCPVPTALPDVVTDVPCYENFGQIQKLVFWRRGKSIASVATAELEAGWTALLASATANKAVPSPFISGGSVVAGEPRQYGSGNEVLDGIPIMIGSEFSQFEGMILRYDQETVAALKELQCEELDVVFINENGQFGYSAVGGEFQGFPIAGFFVSDLTLPGYAEVNRNAIKFSLRPGWSDTFMISNATDFALNMVN